MSSLPLAPPPPEDAATILDHFISDTVNLPSELSHLYSEISARDVPLGTARNQFTRHDDRLQAHIRLHGSHDTTFPNEAKTVETMRKSMKTCLQLQDEKLALAQKALELVERHARRLDSQIAGLVREGVMTADALTPAPPASNLPAASQAVRLMGSRGGTPSGHSGTRRAGRKKPVPESTIDVDGDEDGEGEDKRLYCECQQVSYGSMVGCDDKDCPYEWFHWGCVGLTEEPKGKWYCPHCEKRRAAARKGGS